MRLLLAWVLTLALAGALHVGLRASFTLPAPADPAADDATLGKALDERAKLLDLPTALGLVLEEPLVKTCADVAQKIRGRVPHAFDGSAASRRWYRRQNLTEADRQLEFVGGALGGVVFRGWLAAALAPLAIACFAFRGESWTPKARGSVRSLGVLSLVFVLGPGLVALHSVSIGLALGFVLLAALGFALGGRLTRDGERLVGGPSPA